MAEEKAVPEETQEKKHGDKLDDVLSQGTGFSQDTAAKGTEAAPAKEPLK